MSVIDAILIPFQNFLRYFKQMAPLFWGVSILPYYMGWSLASNKIYPTYIARILLLPDSAPVQNMYLEMFVFLIGLIAIGPLLGGATILFNDFFDRSKDTLSRRKKHLPLVKGLLNAKYSLAASTRANIANKINLEYLDMGELKIGRFIRLLVEKFTILKAKSI